MPSPPCANAACADCKCRGQTCTHSHVHVLLRTFTSRRKKRIGSEESAVVRRTPARRGLGEDVEEGLLLIPAITPALWGLPACSVGGIAWGHTGPGLARGSPDGCCDGQLCNLRRLQG